MGVFLQHVIYSNVSSISGLNVFQSQTSISHSAFSFLSLISLRIKISHRKNFHPRFLTIIYSGEV